MKRLLTSGLLLFALASLAQARPVWTCLGMGPQTVVVLVPEGRTADEVVPDEMARAARLCFFTSETGQPQDGLLEALHVHLKSEKGLSLLMVGSGMSNPLALAYLNRYGGSNHQLMLLNATGLPVQLPPVAGVTVLESLHPMPSLSLQQVKVTRLHLQGQKVQMDLQYTVEDHPTLHTVDLILQQLKHWTVRPLTPGQVTGMKGKAGVLKAQVAGGGHFSGLDRPQGSGRST